MPDSSVILHTRDLARYFGGLRAVDGVDLNIQAGQFHSIIGPNGAGKTTLFNLLSGTLKPTRGQVFLRGRDITALPSHRIAHLGVGRSYQITNIFPTLTVFENVRIAAQALGPDNFRVFTRAASLKKYEDKALMVLGQTGLLGSAGQLAASLPHGDQRRLELAILLAQDPEILLLDEPTAGLAAEQVPQFMQLVDGLRRAGNKTVVLVEHNMSVVMAMSDRISVMHQGRLLAEGAPADIAANEMVQQAYLGELFGDTGETAGRG
jgi:branched-chain amino acid transport system ATP-binding protein